MADKELGCREAFEKWAALGSDPYDLTLSPNGGYYANKDTLNAWYGWLAAHVPENQAYQSRPQDENKELVDKFQKLFELMGDVLTPEQWLQIYELTETVELDPKHLNTYNTNNKAS